ncbi:MAG TPA: beta-ketoacyl-ACP synthase II [Gemmatimonadaceae bacterium]|nr:beta-ketoacyl-ACP synthase II [Gemmatimonadaceae bacterium]
MSSSSGPVNPGKATGRSQAPFTEGRRHRVVITGLGAISPLALSVPELWSSMLAGASGAAPIASFDATGYDTTFACEIKGFDARDFMDRKLANRLDPVCHYAIAAADEALRDAGLDANTLTDGQRERIGVVFGSGIGGIQTFQEQSAAFIRGGPKRVSPFFIPMLIPDMVPGIISIEYGLRGPNHAVVTACATGNHNIADAAMLIRDGQADAIVCGGSEAAICEIGISGFSAMKALSTRNESPATASRPFDATREGFVMGDGAGALILESLEHALARGARIYAEVLGVGASADAHHITAPHPEGLGACLAMERALAQAGLRAEEVDTVNMHGTSTPLGDAAESHAIRMVFGDHADSLTSTSTKSMTGHMLGAAGAVEAIASVLAITDGIVPPTINFSEPDPACDLHYAFNVPERRQVRVAISNAFGFGGHNTCAVFAAYDGPGEHRAPLSATSAEPHQHGVAPHATPSATTPGSAW